MDAAPIARKPAVKASREIGNSSSSIGVGAAGGESLKPSAAGSSRAASRGGLLRQVALVKQRRPHALANVGFGCCLSAATIRDELALRCTLLTATVFFLSNNLASALAEELGDYAGARIVTSFPEVAKKFFQPFDAAAAAGDAKTGPTHIKYCSGSVEAACGLGLADAVVDLVETGTTMRAAGLDILASIMTTEAVLITNPHSKHPELCQKLCARIQGYIDSTKFQLMQYNCPRANLAEAVKITPGKKSPSILPLERDDWVAVSVMVAKREVANIIDRLAACGATDILVFSLSNCRV